MKNGFQVRTLLVLWLFLLSAVGFMDRTNISIAGPAIRNELRLDDVHLGWVFSAFLLGYAAFQVVGGWLAYRFGPRVVHTYGASEEGLVSVLTAPVVDRLHLPFAAVAFSAVVSLMPGFFLFNTATGLVELVSIGPGAPAALLTSIVASGATAFLIIMAMAFGLILPRMLYEHLRHPAA